MFKLLQGASRWLANYTSVFIIGVAVVTMFFPHLFDWVRGSTQTVILGVIMLTMGLTLTTDDFKILARRPLDIFIGACAQFVIMPGWPGCSSTCSASSPPWPWASSSWAAARGACRATS